MMTRVLISFCILMLSAIAPSWADDGIVIPIDGVLTDQDSVVLDGAIEITLRLRVGEGGAVVVHEERLVVDVVAGMFSAVLGRNTALSPTLFHEHAEMFLGIQVEQDSEMKPLIQLGTSPYAAFAHSGQCCRRGEPSQGCRYCHECRTCKHSHECG